MKLLKVIPKLDPSDTAMLGALKRLIALYHQHSAQPWMNALWTEELVEHALHYKNFYCVGMLWTHFNQPLHIDKTARVLDRHHIVLTVRNDEHVIDVRTAEFELEEKLVSYGFIDDYEYTLHIKHEGK